MPSTPPGTTPRPPFRRGVTPSAAVRRRQKPMRAGELPLPLRPHRILLTDRLFPARRETVICTITASLPVNGSSSGSRAKRSVNLSRRAAAQSAQQAKQTEVLARRQTQRTAKGVKEAAQAAKRGAQAAIAAAKSAMTALAAGGGATMFFLLPIIGLLAGSIFAIFLPDEAERVSTRTVIQRIDREYNERLEEIKSDYSYDRLELSGSRPSWREVLAFYAVLVNTDPDNPRDVAVMDEDRADILRKVFWEMIEIEADTGTVTEIPSPRPWKPS